MPFNNMYRAEQQCACCMCFCICVLLCVNSLISMYSGLRPTKGPRMWSFSWRCRVLLSSSSCLESKSDFLLRSSFFNFLHIPTASDGNRTLKTDFLFCLEMSIWCDFTLVWLEYCPSRYPVEMCGKVDPSLVKTFTLLGSKGKIHYSRFLSL